MQCNDSKSSAPDGRHITSYYEYDGSAAAPPLNGLSECGVYVFLREGGEEAVVVHDERESKEPRYISSRC